MPTKNIIEYLRIVKHLNGFTWLTPFWELVRVQEELLIQSFVA